MQLRKIAVLRRNAAKEGCRRRQSKLDAVDNAWLQLRKDAAREGCSLTVDAVEEE